MALAVSRFAGALGADQQHPARERQAEATGFVAEGAVALIQPVLQGRRGRRCLPDRASVLAELQHFAAGEDLRFSSSTSARSSRLRAPALGQGACGHVPHPLLAQATAGMGELLQHMPLPVVPLALRCWRAGCGFPLSWGRGRSSRVRLHPGPQGRPLPAAHDQGVGMVRSCPDRLRSMRAMPGSSQKRCTSFSSSNVGLLLGRPCSHCSTAMG